jgi:tetratricopeptide (TPR) repeat protein
MYEEAYNTGMICNQLKQKEEALKYFGISYEKANNKNALYYLGVINYDLGKMELAKKYLKMAEKNGDEAAKLMLEGME